MTNATASMNAATRLVADTYSDQDRALDAFDANDHGDRGHAVADAVRVYARWLRGEVRADIRAAGTITEDECDDSFAYAFVAAGYRVDDVHWQAIAERTVAEAVRLCRS